MLAAAILLSSLAGQGSVVVEVSGRDASLRIVSARGDLHAEFMMRDASGTSVVAAVSTSHPAVKRTRPYFSSMRGLGLTNVVADAGRVVMQGNFMRVVMWGELFECEILVPENGTAFTINVRRRPGSSEATLKDAVAGFALAPALKPTVATDSYAPACGPTEMITTERLANPVVYASGDGYGVALMPDVADLWRNRPMPPVLHLGADANGTALLAYGFAPYDRDENWEPEQAERALPATGEFSWSFDLLICRAEDIAGKAASHIWSRYGKQRTLKPFPQTVPFRYYTKPTYSLAAFTSDSHLTDGASNLWWTSTVGERNVRAPFSIDGQVRLDVYANLARFAWGLRWWGERLLQTSWVRNADETMNLVLSAPSSRAAFDFAAESWTTEPSDQDSAAQTARWMLRYAESFDEYEAREELIRGINQTADIVMAIPPTAMSTLFLHELQQSSVIASAGRHRSVNQYLAASLEDLRDQARFEGRLGARPSAELVATARVLVESGHALSVKAGRRLLEKMLLSQAVWLPPTIAGTPIFGAMVDETLVHQRQSVYTGDLLRAAAALGDEEMFHRAVSALRAPLALFNHSTHGISGIRYPEMLPSFRMVSWFGRAGQAQYGPWLGAAEGSGQTLTSLAEALMQFGSYFTHMDGWTVGIDGILVDSEGKPYSAFSANPLAFDGAFHYEHVDASSDTRTSGVSPGQYPAMRSLTMTVFEGAPHVTALPGFTVTQASSVLSGRFVFSDGSEVEASFLPTGFGGKALPEQLAAGPVSFEGVWDGRPLSLAKTDLLDGPPAPDAAWPRGWRRMGRLSDVVRTTAAVDGKAVLSTADNGLGASDDALTGVVESQKFLVSGTSLRFTMYGSVDERVYIELTDPVSGLPFWSARPATGGPADVTWELFELVGHEVVFRLVDESGTGSIAVSDLRIENADPR